MEWQPIETVPKDAWVFCFWETRPGLPIDADNYAIAQLQTGDTLFIGQDYEGYPFLPSHWMPLPDPPCRKEEVSCG